jgi:beta-glucosidase
MQGLELDDESKTLIANLKKENPKQPLILILYSGRPLGINEELSIADSVIAAWLPGSEGSGITDVLFGDYKFTGKLTYPWPRDSGQTSFIFDVGYGLES